MQDPVVKPEKTILVVDNVTESREMVVRLLSGKYHVQTASTGVVALEIAKLQQPDLILLDIMVPGINGYQVCQQIKSIEDIQHIPIIFLTALDSPDDETYGLNLGAVDYITKPINPSILLARIHTHLSLYETRKQLEEQNIALKEAAKMREDVEHIMYHDLKAPLSSMVSIPALFREYDNLTERQKAFLDMLEASAWRMLSMIETSLILLKIEYRNYTPDFKNENLPMLIDGVVQEIDQLFRKKKLTIKIEIPEALKNMHILTESLLLSTLLTNLLKNACEASHDQGLIVVQLDENEQNYQLMIENEGEVPDSIRARFFEKFVTSGKKAGTGLGTYSAKLIAGVLHIDLQLDTTKTGYTRLFIHFPILIHAQTNMA